ncbi:ABC transporter domain protein [Candidatus Filomicrobium marinum]|uniref:ABC transporter domain protein n=1 Tax=Candidatus Filomicrobium marinum TaxID=1608628 RepID=A0A0D6JF73_9HYPH|nr:ABC transporter ATP-binding protein/permease [Candidatus Filomicrobium marinum]CFX24773.1 ABC transporter domain protein [Candidatus Filomicrobium marinum]CPR19214.1 ABC transporter domain protein [Candidatus Filomicrobium marinum]
MRSVSRAGLRYASSYFLETWKLVPLILLAAVIACQLGVVAAQVAMNYWRNDFFQSLQDKNWTEFVRQFWVYILIAAALITATVYQKYFAQWLTIHWRDWLTQRFLDLWLANANFYRARLKPKSEDNPDQRIAEDTYKFVSHVISISVGLVGATVTLGSFVTILWIISQSVPVTLFGEERVIPGLLVWILVLYSAAGTLLAHMIGRRLIPLNFEQDRREGDFRFGLMRVRDNAEEIALLNGGAPERGELNSRFKMLAENWYALMARQKMLNFFTEAYKHSSLYIPYLLLAPLYFSGGIQFGAFMQAGSAFAQVRGALSFFVTAYEELSELIAVTQRLSRLENDLGTAQEIEPCIPSENREGDVPRLHIAQLRVLDPTERDTLGQLESLNLARGEEFKIAGPSGSGKTSLVKGIAGIWPYARGDVASNLERTLVLPQRAYMPLGTLKDAVSYPMTRDEVDDDIAQAALRDVGLAALVDNLHDKTIVERLSGGELQRLSVARALLYKPDLLILDEATSALEWTAQCQLGNLVRERLPDTIIIETSHAE